MKVYKKTCLLLLFFVILTIVNGCATMGEGGSGSPGSPIGHQGHHH